jgi:hypothetical protein
VWKSLLLMALLLVCLEVFLPNLLGLTRVLVLVVGDAMDWRSHSLARLGSTNCGRVKIGRDPSKATACALEESAKGRPFRVVYQIQGIDSIVAGGIVRTPGGKLLALNYDSCPSGCGFSLWRQTVTASPCPEPYHLYVNPKGRINCFQPQLAQPSNIMSPNMESY